MYFSKVFFFFCLFYKSVWPALTVPVIFFQKINPRVSASIIHVYYTRDRAFLDENVRGKTWIVIIFDLVIVAVQEHRFYHIRAIEKRQQNKRHTHRFKRCKRITSAYTYYFVECDNATTTDNDFRRKPIGQ